MNRKKLIVAAIVVGVLVGAPAYVVAYFWREIETPPHPVVRATRVDDASTDGAYCLRLTEVNKRIWIGTEWRVRGLAATEWWEFGRATRFAWEDVGLSESDDGLAFTSAPFSKRGEMRVGDLVCGLAYDMWYAFSYAPSKTDIYRSYPNCSSAVDQPSCPGPWGAGVS